jgi:hypothetical protein
MAEILDCEKELRCLVGTAKNNLFCVYHDVTPDPLFLQILEVPSLLEEGSSSVVKRNILKQKQESHAKRGGCCQ